MNLLLLLALAFGLGHHQQPPPRKAHPATRIVFWVCPIKPDGTPVTTPKGVCFRDFAGR